MLNNIKTWNEFFKIIQEKDYSISLHEFLDKQYRDFTCYPPRELLFNAFRLTPLKDVKVVIIGQDPYHEPGQAMGLSFSVPRGIQVPPSLINIYKEIANEYQTHVDMRSGDLTYLAKQGVLLLNSILSVSNAFIESSYILLLAGILYFFDSKMVSVSPWVNPGVISIFSILIYGILYIYYF